MDIQKIILDDWENEDLQLGLIQLVEIMPNHEFFFKLNQLHQFKFSRAEDLKIEGKYYNYQHPVFEAYHTESKTKLRIISNQSSDSFLKNKITELFIDEQEVNYLLKDDPKITYIVKTSDNVIDFSLILLPENIAFYMQAFSLSSQEELYHIIQYYE